MPAVNVIMLSGHLGADADTKEVGGTTLVVFSLATSDGYKDASGQWKSSTDWHRVEVWGKQAEYAKGLKKGDGVTIVGKLKNDEKCEWTDKDGKKHRTPKVRANQVIVSAKLKAPVEADADDMPF